MEPLPPDTLAGLLADLAAAFPRENIPVFTVHLYLAKLHDVPLHLVEEAVHQLICTETRFPALAQIRAVVAELTLELPTETQALAEIEARAVWSRTHNNNGSAPHIHPAVRAALDHVGGIAAFRLTTEPAIIRGQFARYYREIRATRLRALQTHGGPAALSPAEGRILMR